jgi:Winged helix DNA-binding domain
MDDAKLRAWWFHRQGLDGWMTGCTASEVLATAGWARSVAGSGPYLAFFSRAGLSREAVDTALAKLEIHELPSARSCTYILPASDFALGLRVGEQSSGGEMTLARKLGVTGGEVTKLCSAVLDSLRQGPLSPEEIRDATGSTSRNLGPEGAKKGLTTTLPLALGTLQASGKIRRIPNNGRLDQQRYRYALWKPSPVDSFRLSVEESYAELARRYFRWIGPATLKEFRWFSGLGVKAASAATKPLGLVPVESGSNRLMFPGDRELFAKFKAPKAPAYALVSCMDSMFLLRRSLSSLLTAESSKQKVLADKGLCELGSVSDLSSNAILDRGSIVGLWEYDPESSSIAWVSFDKTNDRMRKCVLRTEAYIRDQLGDARSFSLDSPKSRLPRIKALRDAQKKRK